MPVTPTQLREQIAGALNLADPSELGTEWDDIVLQALSLGERDVLGILRGRFIAETVIAAWAYRDATVLQQALFWALRNGAALAEGVTESFIAALDQREALALMALEAVVGGPIGHGPLVAVPGATPEHFIGVDQFVDPNTGRLKDY